MSSIPTATTSNGWNIVPGSLHSRNFGKFLPDTRISTRMIHVGVVVKDRTAADRFYRDILGFKLQWQGGMNNTQR